MLRRTCMCIIGKPYQSSLDGAVLVTALFKSHSCCWTSCLISLKNLLLNSQRRITWIQRLVPFVFSVESLIPSPSQSAVFQLEEGVLVRLANTNEQAFNGSVPSKPSCVSVTPSPSASSDDTVIAIVEQVPVAFAKHFDKVLYLSLHYHHKQ